MPTTMSFTQADYKGEKTVMSVQTPTIDATNFDAQIALILALETAIQDVSLGAKIKRSITMDSVGSLVSAVDSEAQRELKWLVQYHDNGNPQRRLSCEIGCADIIDDTLLQVGIGNKDNADLTDADWVAFIAAFEALVLAPYTGNAVTVDRITMVGRNT